MWDPHLARRLAEQRHDQLTARAGGRDSILAGTAHDPTRTSSPPTPTPPPAPPRQIRSVVVERKKDGRVIYTDSATGQQLDGIPWRKKNTAAGQGFAWRTA